MKNTHGSSLEGKYPIGNAGLGLSLEGLQGTAELNTGRGWGRGNWSLGNLLDLSRQKPCSRPAHEAAGGLLAGIRILLWVVRPKAARDLSMSSGDTNHGIQGWSHILPQQGHV